MYVFMEQQGKLSLNYPCYPFLSGPLNCLRLTLHNFKGTAMFYGIFIKGHNFCEVLLASLDNRTLPK